MPSFFPLELRQGIGINFEAYRSFPLNIDLRIGLGKKPSEDRQSIDQNRRNGCHRRVRKRAGQQTEDHTPEDEKLWDRP